MSWSRRELTRLIVGAASAIALAGCGFQPLYGPGINNTEVSTSLASVRVEPLTDRAGQQMHNFLRDRLNPRGQPADASYSLRIQLTERLQELGVRRDETATRANLRMEADFILLSVDGQTQLMSGESASTTSYDILTNPFATTVSEETARERALREVADDIHTRLALYFAKQ
ncbi:LPS assembly lipoprotein LptE [Pelagibius sp. 7325]|uniref:LPS assembly lipoprotein LptE n=1 Tax=Pelagibius sp. 7325 TaxID=3131994 RepID=UPI0030EB5C7F